MLSFTQEELKDIRYVVVTVSPKADKEKEIKGLLLGYRPLVKVHTQLVSNDEEFIWLQRGNDVYILNTTHYDVGTIEIQISDLITERRPSTQPVQLDRLKMIQEALIADNRTSSNGLIDVSAYKLPPSLQKEMDKDAEKVKITKPGPSRTGAYSPPRTDYSTYKKKEPSTSIIKRTTKYPTSSAILKMKAKVKEIRDGKYEPPDLPAIPADKEDDTQKKATA